MPIVGENYYSPDGQLQGKADIDGEKQVIRIVVEDTMGSCKYNFEKTATDQLFKRGYSVWREPYWNCGIRIDLDDDLALQLSFDGGTLRWSFWNEILIPQMHTIAGSIIMVNSTYPAHFREVRHLIQHYLFIGPIVFGDFTLPFIVAADKQSHPDAWSITELRYVLNLPPDIQLIPCDSNDKESVRQVLLALLETVLSDNAFGIQMDAEEK